MRISADADPDAELRYTSTNFYHYSFFFCRIERPVPVLDATSHPLGTKNLPVQDQELQKTCMVD